MLLMEYADKESFLAEKIENSTSPIKNEEKLRSYAEDILHALDYIHKAGIIHCDIKLENILLQSSDEPTEYPIAKLCDFGLAHLIEPG